MSRADCHPLDVFSATHAQPHGVSYSPAARVFRAALRRVWLQVKGALPWLAARPLLPLCVHCALFGGTRVGTSTHPTPFSNYSRAERQRMKCQGP